MANPEIKITNLDVIVIKGKDAETFLQGQITNDIKLIKDEEKAIYAGYCSPKGRLIAFFLIIKVWDNYFLFCPSSISNGISKKLSMYIMRSEVSLSHLSEDISYFIFHGESKEEKAFKNSGGTLPKNLMQTIKQSNTNNKSGLFSLTKLPGKNHRFFVLGNNKIVESIYSEVHSKQGGLDSNSWHESDIESKIPNIFAETQDKFIPQSLNLDLIDAINFKKGCYIGQENTARMKLKNKVRRKLLAIKADNELKVGDEIKFNDITIGKILINTPYPFAIVKLMDPEFSTFKNEKLKINDNIVELIL